MTLKSIDDKTSVLVLGHTGFLGKTVYSLLQELGVNCAGASLSSGVDLRLPNSLDHVLSEDNFDVMINCAAVVGGIEFGRRHPVSLFKDNLQMTLSILESASKHGVKVINPISNCAYPGRLKVFEEKNFWDGPLDESVLVYGAVRKLGWVGAWAYAQEVGLKSVNLVFPNMYGPGDHLDPVRAHAFGGLVYRILQAHYEGLPSVAVWGSGNPVREWMYVKDAANALISAIDADLSVDVINVGTGSGISIRDLAFEIKREVGYHGDILFDATKPDGALHKTMNGSKGQSLLGWNEETDLRAGIKNTVGWYRHALGY